MGLTQVSTDGVKNDAITKAKIPANQIEASELASSAVTNVKIAAGNVDNTAIGNNQVSLNKLVQGTSSNDGKFLRANNGADPSFETVPLVGGANGVDFNDNVAARFGTGNDFEISHNGSSSIIRDSGAGALTVQNANSEINLYNNTDNEYLARFINGASCELYEDGSKKLETSSTGTITTGKAKVNGGTTARCIDGLNTHSSGGELASFQNEASNHYGGLVISGGEIDRECRLEAAWGSGFMTFWTDNAERMRILSSGKTVFNGTTSNAPVGSVHIKNAFLRLQGANQQSNDFSQQVGIEWSQEDGSDVQVGKVVMRREAWGGAPHSMDFWTRNYSNQVQRALILHHNQNATLTGTLAQSGSDIRLKENITQIPNALTKVNSLTGFTYNWNKTAQDLGYQGLEHDDLQVGLSAQDVEKIQPEVIKPMGADPNYKTIQYERLIPLLVESIKELSLKVAALEAA